MPQRPSAVYSVYRNGLLATNLEIISFGESAGAERLDMAVLELKNATIENLDVAALLNDEIEIVRDQTGEVMHWGKVSAVPAMLSAGSGETLNLVSRTELYHMGSKVAGYWIWNPVKVNNASGAVEAGPQLIDGEIVFNPMIDGKVEGNLNSIKTSAQDEDGNQIGFPLFLDQESARTPEARLLQGGASAERWTLAKAVYYLVRSLNPDQTYLTNPTLAELEVVFNDPALLVQDVRIPRGIYLGQALDILLNPLGYHWRIVRTPTFTPPAAPVDPISTRSFSFWKRGTGGNLVWLKHQAMGSTLDTLLTTAETVGVTYDAARLANQIVVYGGFLEFEAVMELYPAWPQSLDTLWEKEATHKKGDNFDAVRDVGRKWVLNEAGDYIGMRPEFTSTFTNDLREALKALTIFNPLTLQTERIFNYFPPRRRKLLPTLTLNEKNEPMGEVQGVRIEYFGTDDTDESPEPVYRWLTAGHGWSLLEREAGVYLDSEWIPDELLPTDGYMPRIRVTATLQADKRLQGHSPRPADSPNDDDVPLVLDLPDRFRYRRQASPFTGKPSLAVDDTAVIIAFGDFVQSVEDALDVGGAVQLEGVDHSYTLGDRVQGIQGKNVSFELRAASGMFPQIVGIERNIRQQTMVVHLTRLSSPIPLPSAQRGTSRQFAPRSVTRGRQTL